MSSSAGTRPNGENGFTLVEVVISLALLGFLSVGIMSLLAIAIRQNKLSQTRSVATGLASERIQQLTAMRYQGAADYADYALPYETAAAGPPQTLTADYGDIPGFPEYKRVVTLNYDVPVSGMLKVESEVTWQDLHQGEKTHTMITYLHPRLEQGI